VTSTSSVGPSQGAPAVRLIEESCRTIAAAAEGPVRLAVATVTVPIEVARTSFNILRLSEELLEEVVFLLRSMRPVVAAVSTSRQADQLATVLRTLEQIQQSADAITRTPIGVVRSVLAPGLAPRDGSAQHVPVIATQPRPERARRPQRPGGWPAPDQTDDQHGEPELVAEHLLRTPSVVVRIASITVTMPSIAVGKPSRSLRLPGSGHRRPRLAT
jgi:hypothetical protein